MKKIAKQAADAVNVNTLLISSLLAIVGFFGAHAYEKLDSMTDLLREDDTVLKLILPEVNALQDSAIRRPEFTTFKERVNARLDDLPTDLSKTGHHP